MDYSIVGLEEECVVERKDLSDLVHSLTIERAVFVKRLKLMSGIRHRLLLITVPLTQVKAPYPQPGNPNRIFQSLVAILAGLNIPFLCTDTHELGEEAVASYSIRFTSITGLRPTTTAASWSTMISNDHGSSCGIFGDDEFLRTTRESAEMSTKSLTAVSSAKSHSENASLILCCGAWLGRAER